VRCGGISLLLAAYVLQEIKDKEKEEEDYNYSTVSVSYAHLFAQDSIF